MNFYRIILAVLVAMAGSFSLRAENTIIKNDSKTIIGRLDNGMTYYIRSNSNNPGKADFYIVHNVGALQEEDNQNGLAHFLEHMAFNGTKHYPNKDIFPFLAKEGVRFGYNINAYTSRYETVYYLTSVPLVRESFTDSVLTVIKDWSCEINCEQDALDAERGVVREEWRRRDEPRSRMMYKQTALVYKGSKHPHRTVLGTLDVIDNFKREEIMDFYHKWYRPDLQAVIVTGDFDAKAMEQVVRRKFGDIPARTEPIPEMDVTPVPFNGPVYENMLDKDVKYYVLKVIHRQAFPDAEQRRGTAFLKDMLIRQMISTVVDERLKKMVSDKESNIRSAVMVTSPSDVEFYTSLFTITPKTQKKMEDALVLYYTCVNRLIQFGISDDEMESARYKMVARHRLDQQKLESELTAKEIADACKEHFLRGYPCVFGAEKNAIMSEVLEGITLEDLNSTLPKMFVESEKIYSYCTGEKMTDIIPSKERMIAIADSVGRLELSPDFITFKKLNLTIEPEQCTIAKTTSAPEGEIWTLSNGVKVYWTPVGKVQPNVSLAMRLSFRSGYEAFSEKGSATERTAVKYIDRHGGLQGVGRMALRTLPQASGVTLSASIGRYNSDVNVFSNAKNVEKAFVMTAIQFEQPYLGEQKDLDDYKDGILSSLAKKQSVESAFKEEVLRARFDSNPSTLPAKEADVNRLDMEMVKRVWRQAFSGDVSVYLSSDLDKEAVKGLVCKYLGSIPCVDNGIKKVKALVPAFDNVVITKTTECTSAPKTNVEYTFSAKTSLTSREILAFDILDYVMSTRYVNLIREERGGTYHVSFDTEINPNSKYFESVVSFQTRPELKEMLIADVTEELERAVDGISEEEFDNAVRYLRKYRGERMAVHARSLMHSVDRRESIHKYGLDPDYNFEEVLKTICVKDIRKLAARVSKAKTLLSVYTEE